jgi:flagellar motor switch protein FliN/FliY
MEIDALGEILNISLGSSATSVSQLLGQPVSITTPVVNFVETKDFDIHLYEPAVGVEVKYTEGLSGSNILILKRDDVRTIVGLLLQTDFSDKEFELDEMNIGAICEVMNQMMGAAATALSQFLNKTVNISPPSSFDIASTDEFKKKYLQEDKNIIAVQFDLKIGSLVNSKFINIMRVNLAKELVSSFGVTEDDMTDVSNQPPAPAQQVPQAAAQSPAPAQQVPQAAAQSPAPAQQVPQAAAQPSAPAQQVPQPATQYPAPAQQVPQAAAQPSAPAQQVPPQQNYRVSNAVYQSFDKGSAGKGAKLTENESENLNLMMSVPLQVSVEIGRTTKKIKEILDFSSGTIVELNRQAGSQVDVYVNGKAIARGNVVVVDDNYGVRITEVMNSELMKLI